MQLEIEPERLGMSAVADALVNLATIKNHLMEYERRFGQDRANLTLLKSRAEHYAHCL